MGRLRCPLLGAIDIGAKPANRMGSLTGAQTWRPRRTTAKEADSVNPIPLRREHELGVSLCGKPLC